MKHAAHARVSLEGKSTRENRTISKDGPQQQQRKYDTERSLCVRTLNLLSLPQWL